MKMFRNKLFEKLFASLHACSAGSRGSNPGRDMSVSGALVKDGDDLGPVNIW